MPQNSIIRLVLSLLVSWCGASAAHAAFLVQYEMAGQPGNQASTAATFSAPGTTGLDLTRGPGLTAVAGANSMNSSAWTGPNANDFYSFGFSVGPGSVAVVETLRFATRSSATGPGFVNVLYSVDGGSETLITTIAQADSVFSNNLLTLGTSVTAHSSLVVILRSANNSSANGGTIAGAGTLRIGDYSPNGGQSFDPISVEGNLLSVPAPPSLVLAILGVGLVGVGRLVARWPRPTASCPASC